MIDVAVLSIVIELTTVVDVLPVVSVGLLVSVVLGCDSVIVIARVFSSVDVKVVPIDVPSVPSVILLVTV